jgi:hypothetical protein
MKKTKTTIIYNSSMNRQSNSNISNTKNLKFLATPASPSTRMQTNSNYMRTEPTPKPKTESFKYKEKIDLYANDFILDNEREINTYLDKQR